MLCFFHSHVSQCVPLQLPLGVNSQRDHHGLDNLTKDEENQQRTESLTARHDPGQEYSITQNHQLKLGQETPIFTDIYSMFYKSSFWGMDPSS
jgi:hypothetical protein